MTEREELAQRIQNQIETGESSYWIAEHLIAAGYRKQPEPETVRRYAKARIPGNGLDISRKLTAESLKREKDKYDAGSDADETHRLNAIITEFWNAFAPWSELQPKLVDAIQSYYAQRQSERERQERLSTLAEILYLIKDSDGDLDFVEWRVDQKYKAAGRAAEGAEQ